MVILQLAVVATGDGLIVHAWKRLETAVAASLLLLGALVQVVLLG
jgi:hypothetical protein